MGGASRAAAGPVGVWAMPTAAQGNGGSSRTSPILPDRLVRPRRSAAASAWSGTIAASDHSVDPRTTSRNPKSIASSPTIVVRLTFSPRI